MQCASAILSSVACPALQKFFQITSYKSHIFFEKFIEHKMFCFDFLYNFFSETFLTLRRTERDMVKSVYRSSCKVPVIIVRL